MAAQTTLSGQPHPLWLDRGPRSFRPQKAYSMLPKSPLVAAPLRGEPPPPDGGHGMPIDRVARLGTLLGALLIFGACAGSGDSTEEATGDTATSAMSPEMGSDSAMAGMQHDSASDPNQQFLRMMVDHHQGMIGMAEQAMQRGSTDAVKTEAHAMHTKQQADQQQMRTMLQQQYSDDHQPSMMPSNQAMMDSLSATQGADYDMAFRMNVIQHHREGIQMIDQHLAHLTGDVRSMAERMKTEQQQEIQKLESEMQH